MDALWQQVYDWIWILGLIGIGGLLIFHRNNIFQLSYCARELPPLVLFCLMQCFLCRFSYGRADAYGCMETAAYFFVTGKGIAAVAGCQLLVFLLLIVVQVVKGNIGRNGQLRQPVPYIPYLTTVFLAEIFLL